MHTSQEGTRHRYKPSASQSCLYKNFFHFISLLFFAANSGKLYCSIALNCERDQRPKSCHRWSLPRQPATRTPMIQSISGLSGLLECLSKLTRSSFSSIRVKSGLLPDGACSGMLQWGKKCFFKTLNCSGSNPR